MLLIRLAPHLPHGIAWSAGKIDDKQGRLFAIEERAVAAAVPKRQTEFRAGRTCARETLTSLGCADVAIPIGPDRAPCWPEGFIGSISHSLTFAACLAARDTTFTGIGIDIEEDHPLTPDLSDIIMRSDERSGLPPVLTLGAGSIDTAKAVMVVKEAVFKAVFPHQRIRFDFHHVVVSLHAEIGHFSAELHLTERWPSVQVVKGSIGHDAGHIFAIATIPL